MIAQAIDPKKSCVVELEKALCIRWLVQSPRVGEEQVQLFWICSQMVRHGF